MASVNILDSTRSHFLVFDWGRELESNSKHADPRVKVTSIFSGTCEANTTLFST